MGLHVGRFGLINESTCRSWSISDDTSPKRWLTSQTAGGSARTAGVRSWSGSANFYGGTPPVMPNEVISFEGLTAPDDDVEGNAGVHYSGSARVSSVEITWSFLGDDIILMNTVNFAGHLALTVGSDTIADATTPEVYPVALCPIKWDTAGANTLANWTQCVLTVTADIKPYVNSDTVVAGVIWTGQEMGNIDWAASITVQDTARTGLPVIGNDYDWELYQDATDYWDLQQGHVASYSGITVDRETGNIVEATINVMMSGHDLTSVGRIRRPGDVADWWPGV